MDPLSLGMMAAGMLVGMASSGRFWQPSELEAHRREMFDFAWSTYLTKRPSFAPLTPEQLVEADALQEQGRLPPGWTIAGRANRYVSDNAFLLPGYRDDLWDRDYIAGIDLLAMSGTHPMHSKAGRRIITARNSMQPQRIELLKAELEEMEHGPDYEVERSVSSSSSLSDKVLARMLVDAVIAVKAYLADPLAFYVE